MFSGTDVEEALASAAASLGLPIAGLRYVVLDAGTAGGRGLKPTPARIAVMIQEPGVGRSGSERDPRERSTEPRRRASERDVQGESEGAGDPRANLPELVRAVAAAGGLEIDGVVEDTEEALVLQLRGRDTDFFLGEDGRGELLLAFEHVLQRIHGAALYPQPLRVRCEGFRERRDQALAEEARRLAAEVRADGEPRTMEPLNAYERRIVHLALQEDPEVTTFSVGEGRARRVRVARKGAEPSEPDSEPGTSGGESSSL